jgi:hypothetical protein
MTVGYYDSKDENMHKAQAIFQGGVLSKCVYLSVAPPLWAESALDRP